MFTQLVEGPFWYAAATVFTVGIVWRLASMLRLGIKRDLAVARASGLAGALWTNLRRFWPRRELARTAGVQTVAGYMFHAGLFILLLWGAPHVKFIEERILGVGWTPLPYWAFVLSAQFAFAGLLVLWLYRLLHPVTRLLSTLDDHVGAALVFLVMLSGCMALSEFFAGLKAFHLLTVELLMIYFPFSSLMHTFTFAFSRGFTGAIYGRRGINV